MALTEKQIALAQTIDAWVKGIEQRGGSDAEILKKAITQMGTFRLLMNMSSANELNVLVAQYPGFGRFARLLEKMAQGVQNGDLNVPKRR